MPSPHLREDLPFSPTDLVLRYSLEQHATHLGDAFETAAQQSQIEVVAESFDGGGEVPVRRPVGWARVTIVTRDHGANLYEVFDAIDGDHETIAAALFDPRDGDLSKDLEERYPLILGDVLLCETACCWEEVHFDPPFVYQRRRGCGWASVSFAIGSSTTWPPLAAART
jgi:hypothetical protein